MPGGLLHVATDDAEYALAIREAFQEAGGYRAADPQSEGAAAGRATAFEERWRAMGRSIHLLEFCRREEVS